MVLGAVGTAALGFGTALGAAGATYFGQRQTNEANRNIAREQMQFQERMSSTAYQRAMLDMEQAGLNPILAYRQGGASTPTGASIAQQNEIGPAVSSAIDAKRSFAEIANMNAQNEKIKADTDLSRALYDAAVQDANVKGVTAKNLSVQTPGLEAKAKIDGSVAGPALYLWDRLNPLSFLKFLK